LKSGLLINSYYRLLNLQLPLSKKALILLKKLRCGPTLPSEDQKHQFRREYQRSCWEEWRHTTLSTSMLYSRTHWAASPPSRLLRTTTLLYLSFTKDQTSKWSNKPANNFTRSRLRKSTLLTLQEEKRRPMLLSPAIKTPLTSLTRSALCEITRSQYSNYTRKQKEDQWFNQSRLRRFCTWLSTMKSFKQKPTCSLIISRVYFFFLAFKFIFIIF